MRGAKKEYVYHLFKNIYMSAVPVEIWKTILSCRVVKLKVVQLVLKVVAGDIRVIMMNQKIVSILGM